MLRACSYKYLIPHPTLVVISIHKTYLISLSSLILASKTGLMRFFSFGNSTPILVTLYVAFTKLIKDFSQEI